MSSLVDIKAAIGEKRTYDMKQQEIEGKLSSKKDWYQYLA